MSLKARLKAQIAAHGPMGVDQFMAACLHDPQDGYYAVRPALGAEGDFVTAPLVSQIFGEMIGLWLLHAWTAMGRPGRVVLAEGGPGDGTLAGDVLRALRLEPALLEAAELVLVETSPVLRAAQARRLQDGPLAPRWASSVEDLPRDAPLLFVANELLDCLPARQFARGARGWAERVVGLGPDGELAFGLSPRPVGSLFPDAPAGAVLELSPAQEALGAALGARIARQGGAALLIDYGRDRFGTGDTLQALKGHRKVDPLAEPGRADLTVHADFPAVAAAAERGGARTLIATQGGFLLAMGAATRAEALAAARPDLAGRTARQLARLTAPDQMGALFKVLAVVNRNLPDPPGFEAQA